MLTLSGIRRLSRSLRHYLHTPLTLAQARQMAADGRAHRADRLLSLFQDRIYGAPDSPYLALLRHAGVSFGDVRTLVEREGVEGALARLAAEGVWLSLEEFKGRRPIRRGSLELRVSPQAFDPPAPPAGRMEVRSGATHSRGTPAFISFDLLTEETAHHHLLLSSLRFEGGALAIWRPILPGSGGIKLVLRYAKMGRPPDRWFSHVPVHLWSTDRARWLTQVILRLGRLHGVSLPLPEYVPLDAASMIARWAAAQREAGRAYLIFTYASSAVRICAAALEDGLRLDGGVFVTGGEPLTETRAATIRATGASTSTTYSMAESGPIGMGCGEPEAIDDVHLLLDRAAIVQQPSEVADVAVDAFLLTTLSPHTPKILLNVQIGDGGRLVHRPCGCAHGRLGYHWHLHTISSHEKLTSEGMLFLVPDLVDIIERVLPARFGGTPTDYQMLEEHGDDGFSRLNLIVSPRVGPVDDEALLTAVQESLRQKSRVGAQVWRQAGTIRVQRREPILTPRGKLFPFHTRRPQG